jgi:3-phenylpropionate/trans-cinnamate dioxygenase ferredoxin reductase subunit
VTTTLTIVGAGLAGAKAAEAARDIGFDGRIVLVGEEATSPYERPPLSKEILRGERPPEAARVHPDGFYADQAVELADGQAVRLDLASRRVQLDNGERLPFDRLVLATGAAPRRLTAPGSDLPGVHYLRTLEDARLLGDAIRAAGRVAVVGAGWIGSEVAASARQMGAEVVLVDPALVPLHRVLGPRIGGVFRDLHADHGVELRLGVGVRELRGTERVDAMVLDDGRTEPADVVVVGIGVTPRTELAEAAGLRVDDGVVVDEHLHAGEGVYAAGDVANAWHPHYGRHLRVEHWANALHQGVTAGHNATGNVDVYDRLPYFFSDQYDLGMEYVGHAAPGDEVVVRGDLGAREFVAFWRRDGVVTAAMNVNVWDIVDDLRALVASRRPIEPAVLADPAIRLADLVSATTT